MSKILKRTGYGLNIGYDTFKQGFTAAGLDCIPKKIDDKITQLGYTSYEELILAKQSSDRRYWAPEIREERCRLTLIPYIYEIINDLQNDMALELTVRVNDPDNSWTHEKAQDFACNKAGALMLALFGDLKPS